MLLLMVRVVGRGSLLREWRQTAVAGTSVVCVMLGVRASTGVVDGRLDVRLDQWAVVVSWFSLETSLMVLVLRGVPWGRRAWMIMGRPLPVDILGLLLWRRLLCLLRLLLSVTVLLIKTLRLLLVKVHLMRTLLLRLLLLLLRWRWWKRLVIIELVIMLRSCSCSVGR